MLDVDYLILKTSACLSLAAVSTSGSALPGTWAPEENKTLTSGKYISVSNITLYKFINFIQSKT